MMEKYISQLQDYNKFIKDDIKMIQEGAKLNSLRREEKGKQKQLKQQLTNTVIRQIAKTGDLNVNVWAEIRNLFIIVIKQILDQYNEKYKDSKTFEQEKEVILMYFFLFQRPPFTIQRIAQLTISPQKYYKSCKKILYAYQKLVNVCDPEQR